MYAVTCGSTTRRNTSTGLQHALGHQETETAWNAIEQRLAFACQKWNGNLLTLLKSDIYISELYSRFALCKMVGDMLRMRMRSQSSLICRLCEIRKYLQMWDTAISILTRIKWQAKKKVRVHTQLRNVSVKSLGRLPSECFTYVGNVSVKSLGRLPSEYFTYVGNAWPIQ